MEKAGSVIQVIRLAVSAHNGLYRGQPESLLGEMDFTTKPGLDGYLPVWSDDQCLDHALSAHQGHGSGHAIDKQASSQTRQ